MKNWHLLVAMAACFVIVGLIDSPEYYDFRSADPVLFKHETAVMKQRAALVENSVDKACPACVLPVSNSLEID